jgi:hypothetical protein
VELHAARAITDVIAITPNAVAMTWAMTQRERKRWRKHHAQPHEPVCSLIRPAPGTGEAVMVGTAARRRGSRLSGAAAWQVIQATIDRCLIEVIEPI